MKISVYVLIWFVLVLMKYNIPYTSHIEMVDTLIIKWWKIKSRYTIIYIGTVMVIINMNIKQDTLLSVSFRLSDSGNRDKLTFRVNSFVNCLSNRKLSLFLWDAQSHTLTQKKISFTVLSFTKIFVLLIF